MSPRERLAVTTEAIEHAEAAGHTSRVARARLLLVGSLLELGAIRRRIVRARAIPISGLVDRHPAPPLARGRARLRSLACAVSSMRRRNSPSLLLIEDGKPESMRPRWPSASICSSLHMHWGRLAELRPALDAFAASRPDLTLWTLGAALSARAGGDHEAAHATLSKFVTDLPGLDQDDEFWSNQLVVAAQLAWELDAHEAVAEALDLRLRRCHRRFEVFGASSATLGPVDRVRGLMAALRGDHEGAAALLLDAFEQCRSLDASPWLVWVAADLISELRILGRAPEAQRLAAKLAPVAAKLGMTMQLLRIQ